MRFKIPTIAEFNKWSISDKLWWIDYETDGKYTKLNTEEGFFPMIIYRKENVGILYKVDSKGELIEAKAMTVDECFAAMQRLEIALAGISKENSSN